MAAQSWCCPGENNTAPGEWLKVQRRNGGLVLANSLVDRKLVSDRKVPFVPAAGANSKDINWYTCGPTVYDSAHMGHAKNYVSFDVVRRVLEDYFGYNILFVMNVTDVEDKIVFRARRNYLLKNYVQATTDYSKVLTDAKAATAFVVTKQQKAVDEARQAVDKELAQGVKLDPDEPTEAQQNLLDEEKKLSNALAAQQRLDALGSSTEGGSVEAIFSLCGDALAEHLDSQHGAEVTDLTIFREHAARYEQEFLEDLDSLGCRPPDVLTRVSEYIPEIIEYIQRIQDNGMAYVSNNSVHFDTQAFRKGGHGYGKLKPGGIDTADIDTEPSETSGEKRNTFDFALWKAAKPGEPFWDSPWGKGRPGWHIECSAMASSVIGQTIDIHSGGEDLKFPHHNNEIAQAEAYYHTCNCHQWVNYFLHAGHLGIEGLKMSKSLKNFITIREALETFSARQLRLMFVLTPYDKKMNYGHQLQAETAAKEALIRNFFQNVEVACREFPVMANAANWKDEEFELSKAIQTAQKSVHAALLDNINTGGAMDALCDMIKAVNKYLGQRNKTEAGGHPPQAFLLRKASSYVTFILACFGLVEHPKDRPGFRATAEAASSSGVNEEYLNTLSAFRDEIRTMAKAQAPLTSILEACDRLRDSTLVDLGVQLEDRPDGKAIWKLESPAVLREQQAQRQREAAAAKLKKLENLLERKQKDFEKFVKLAGLPSPEEALAGKYGKFDPQTGEPTHDAQGAPLEGKALEKAKKDVEKQRKVKAPLTKKLEEDPLFMEKLSQEIAQLKLEQDELQNAACNSTV